MWSYHNTTSKTCRTEKNLLKIHVSWLTSPFTSLRGVCNSIMPQILHNTHKNKTNNHNITLYPHLNQMHHQKQSYCLSLNIMPNSDPSKLIHPHIPNHGKNLFPLMCLILCYHMRKTDLPESYLFFNLFLQIEAELGTDGRGKINYKIKLLWWSCKTWGGQGISPCNPVHTD